MTLRPESWRTGIRLDRLQLGLAPIGRAAARIGAEANESRLLFGGAAVAFLILGLILLYVGQIVVGDAWSRVGNATYMLFSRDPHLAAIGFVWNPLPSLAVLPLLPLSVVWPDLVRAGFAGNVVSAVFMAGAVVQVAGALRDLGVGRLPRLLLTACFALHPMILYYAANGMSEAPFLFFLIVTIRYLARWVEKRTTPPLVIAGLGLAFAYLTRYEAAAAAAGAIVLVFVLAAVRAPRGARRITAVADAATFGVPFASAFGLWALASWIIVGSPFETFTSVYGNSSQVALSAEAIQSSTGRGVLEASEYAIAQIQGLEPLLIVGLALVGLVIVRQRDLRIVPALVVFGAVVAFSLFAFATGKSFGWLRFYIAVVPLVVLAAGYLVSARAGLRAPRVRATRALVTAAAITAVASAVLGLPAAAATIRDDRLAREEAHQLRGVIPDPTRPGDVPPERKQYLLGRDVAGYLDSLGIADGKVLVDVAIGFPVVLQSADPRQFVITPDRDFEAVVQDPVIFGIDYVLVSPPTGLGGLDAISRQYPLLYATGDGLPVTLAREFVAPGSPGIAWRLYRVNRAP